MKHAPLWRSTAAATLVALTGLLLSPPAARAGWVSTRQALEGPRARLVSVLERREIARALEDLGVDPAEARRRARGLTDAEARRALEGLDALPAGGDPVGAVVGAGVVVFLVLLITDILGFTDVFPFVKKTVR
ncbi:MAG: hypothetical protein Kow0092_35750 [Deferrisomatales bacterium]